MSVVLVVNSGSSSLKYQLVDVAACVVAQRPQQGPQGAVEVEAVANDESGKVIKFEAISRLDSRVELEYYKNGGILHYVLRQFINQA